MSDRYGQRPLELPAGATEVVLVRHGASVPAVPGRPFPLTDGHGDPPLSAAGERQARALADRLAAEAPSELFVTGLVRTAQTAAPLAERLAIEPSVVTSLREVRLGDWEGGEFRIRVHHGDPVAVRAIEEERWDVIPGAESMPQLAARVRAGFLQVVERAGPGRRAVAVVHGGVIAELCRQATDSRAFAFLHADNCSISRIYVLPGGRWLLRSFNDTAHLAEPGAES